jgi:outer membrane protein assembly factor BamB
VQWRFQADGLYIAGRPAVGADGSVYTADVGAILYGLEADGGVKWIFRGQPNNYGPVSIGPDLAGEETVYYAGGPTVYALDPADGSLKWSFTDPDSSQTIAGPNVGPDNNIYAVTRGVNEGLGMYSLSPAGALRWSTPVSILDESAFGLEVIFSPAGQQPVQVYYAASGQASGRTDGRYFLSFDAEDGDQLFARPAYDQPWAAPSGIVWARTMNGQITAYNAVGQQARRMNGAVHPGPVVGPDNTVYVGRAINNLSARRPSGALKWQFAGTGFLDDPAVQPQNTMVVFGGYVVANPGYVQAVATANGQPLWNVPLPAENGGFIWPFARPRFSADGAMVYVGMTGNNYAPDPYTYLYAIATAP